MTDIDPTALLDPAMDTLPINVAILDDTGTILLTNRAWQVFATANDLQLHPDTVGVNYLEVTDHDPDEYAHAASEGIRSVLAGERDEFTLEYPCHSPDEKRWFILRAAPFIHDDRRFLTVAHINVTDRKLSELETQRQSEKLSKQRQQLTLLNRILRHDIRNDMNVILGWSEELQNYVDSAGQSMLDRITQTGQHVVDLTTTIRDSIETLTMDTEPPLEPIELRRNLIIEIDKIRETHPNAYIEIDGEVPAVTVQANDLLASVFRNVLMNAIEHNDADNPVVNVSVEVVEQTGTVRISIADNGPGIPSKHRDAVFGRTADGVDHPAAGLGLHLVDLLVDSYGGTITVTENEPRGARFTVDLLLADGG